MDARISALRAEELPAELQTSVYLDAAGMPLCPKTLMRRSAEHWGSQLWANPHSHSPAAARSKALIEEAREKVCEELFCLSPRLSPPAALAEGSSGGAPRPDKGKQRSTGWELVFTSGATQSLKLAVESYAFGEEGRLLMPFESHTSVVGLRSLAPRSDVWRDQHLQEGDLLVLPLQCNATGSRHFDRIEGLRERGRAKVLVDAASYLSSSSRLPLPSEHDEEAYAAAPDFIAFSFYKVFGAPTGLGGLLVKSTSAQALSAKRYFGGGTLSLLLPGTNERVPRRRLADRMEDGTLNLQGIGMLSHAFAVYEELCGSWEERQKHTSALADQLRDQLKGLRHWNDQPLVQLLGGSPESPIIAFLLRGSNGARIPLAEISRLAALRSVHIRIGRHCNAGSAISNTLGLGSAEGEEVMREVWEAGTGCENADGAEDPASSIRASLCVWNTSSDVETFVQFLREFFLVGYAPRQVAEQLELETPARHVLKSITLYPIKSCAGQEMTLRGESWPLTPFGLQHDREWCIVDLASGKALSQKRVPRMAMIKAAVDREKGVLQIHCPDQEPLEVALTSSEGDVVEGEETMRVCADMVQPQLYTDADIRSTLSEFLKRDCTLARFPPSMSRERHGHFLLPGTAQAEVQDGLDGPIATAVPILLSNESPFLAIREGSVHRMVQWLHEDRKELHSGEGQDWMQVARRFRANLIYGEDGGEALSRGDSDGSSGARSISADSSDDDDERQHGASTPMTSIASSPAPSVRAFSSTASSAFVSLPEDAARSLRIGGNAFVKLGACRRCEMVAVDQETGEKRGETLLSLAKRRRNADASGRVEFGIHLAWRADQAGLDAFLAVGDSVYVA